MALFIAGLDKKVDQRKALITKLEHAIALKNLTGISPTHSQRWLSGRSDRIDSIEAYTIELELLNADISDQVNTYARARRPKLPYSQTALASSRHLCQKEVGREKQRVPLLNHQNGSSLLNPDEVESLPQSYTREMESMGTEIGNDPLAIPDELPTIDTVNIETMNHSKSYMAALKKVFAFLISAASSKIKGASQLSSAVATNAIRSTEGLTHSAMSMLGKDAEGRNRDAGFVTFTTLRSTHIAIQNIQHSEPFVLDIEPAPDPSEIFWDNVGRPLHQVQAGKLVSVGMTVGLCLFWTIPGMCYFVWYVLFLLNLLTLCHSFSHCIPHAGRIPERYYHFPIQMGAALALDRRTLGIDRPSNALNFEQYDSASDFKSDM